MPIMRDGRPSLSTITRPVAPSQRREPSGRTIRYSMSYPELGRLERRGNRGGEPFGVGRMHVAANGLHGSFERAGLAPVNHLELGGPAHPAASDVPVPGAHVAGGEGEGQAALVGLAQRRLGLCLLPQIPFCDQARLERHGDPVMLERERHVIGDLLRDGDLGVGEGVRVAVVQHELAEQLRSELQRHERERANRLAPQDGQERGERGVLVNVGDQQRRRRRFADRPGRMPVDSCAVFAAETRPRHEAHRPAGVEHEQ